MSRSIFTGDCQLDHIEDFELEKDIAKKILAAWSADSKAIVIFELEDKAHLYCQSNFKILETSPCPWKCTRTLRELVEKQIFQQITTNPGMNHQLAAILFSDAALLKKFAEHPAMRSFFPLFRQINEVNGDWKLA